MPLKQRNPTSSSSSPTLERTRGELLLAMWKSIAAVQPPPKAAATVQPRKNVRAVAQAEQMGGREMTRAELAALLTPQTPGPVTEARMTRAFALQHMFSLLP